MFARLRDSLGRSRRALTEQIGVESFDPADASSWERLEEALIAADVGVPATAELVQRLEARNPADVRSWERLEEALIAADVGVPATAELVQRLEACLLYTSDAADE